jgi:hypothetical protein
MNDHLDVLLQRAAPAPDASTIRVRPDIFVLPPPAGPPEPLSPPDPEQGGAGRAPHRMRAKAPSPPEPIREEPRREPYRRAPNVNPSRLDPQGAAPTNPPTHPPTNPRTQGRRAPTFAAGAEPQAGASDLVVARAPAAGTAPFPGRSEATATITRPDAPRAGAEPAQPQLLPPSPPRGPTSAVRPPVADQTSAVRPQSADPLPVLRPSRRALREISARDPQDVAPPPAPIEIVIDRIDVRLAATAPPSPPRPVAPRAALPLADYLDRRSRG